MTSTRNGDATSSLRHFPTPAWAIDAVLNHVPLSGVIVDAGCGAGAILRRLEQRAPAETTLIGVELQEQWVSEAEKVVRRSYVVRDDFLRPVFPWSVDPTIAGLHHASLVIGNPPFSLAPEFAQRGLELTAPVNGTVALLLRNDWVAARERTEWVERNKPDKLIMNRRPQFRMLANGKRGSDSCDYCWAIWGPGRGGRWSIANCPPAERRTKRRKVA